LFSEHQPLFDQPRFKKFLLGGDPGLFTLVEGYSEAGKSFRVSGQELRSETKLKKGTNLLFKHNTQFKLYQHQLKGKKSLELNFNQFQISKEMLVQIKSNYWNKKKREQEIRSQQYFSNTFKRIEVESGFAAAKEENPDTQMVFGLGSFAFSPSASKKWKGRRPAALKKFVGKLSKKYECFSVPESWTTKV